MANTASRVVITPGSSGPSSQVQAHHGDFPEIRGNGENAADAAGQLINQLTRTLDSALTTWRRDQIQAAIADVQEFLAKS